MKNLFENWREYLTEGMKTPEDLPDDVYIGIRGDGRDRWSVGGINDVIFYYSYSDGEEIDPYAELQGMIIISPAGGELVGGQKEGSCDGAWVVMEAEASEGWGPLLYDVAIEWATINGGQGLTPDRTSVSKEALAVWDFYLKNRSDVNNSQLDNLDNKLTPRIKQDNCNQKAAVKAAGRDWHNSSLSKRYTKAPDVLQKLRAAGRLIEK